MAEQTEFRKRSVAVISPCGGSGASILCKETGLWLSKKQISGSSLRVLIADLHNGNGSQETLMNFPDCRYSFGNLLKNLRDLPEHTEETLLEFASWENIERFLCYDRGENIYVLTAPESAVKPPVNVSEALCILGAVSQHFDVTLIDPPCGLQNAAAQAALEHSDRIIFTLRDDADSIEKMMELRGELKRTGFLQKAEQSGGLVLLSLSEKSRYMTQKEIEEYLGIRVLTKIPFFEPAWTYTNVGNTMTGSDTPVAPSYEKVCRWIAAEIS